MRNAATLLTLAAMLLASLPGCATTDPAAGGHQGAAIGAGAGAVSGAVIGGIVGGKRGAVAGGLLGALAGGLIGNYYDQKEKTLAETRQAHADCTPAKGMRLRIEGMKATPPEVLPGQSVDIQITYAVLTPQENETVPVRETRRILHNGEAVGDASVDIEREGGTWRSVVSITLPANARPGAYRVVATVESRGGGKESAETTFRVRP